MGNTLSKKELEILYNKIIYQMCNIEKIQDTPKGIAMQKEIIRKIDEHPEVLRVQTGDLRYKTIGIYAAINEFFYITMRALQDTEACELRAGPKKQNIYELIKRNKKFQERIVNSWQYARLVKRLEARLAGEEEPHYNDDDLFDDEYEDMDQYDSIME